MKYNYENSLRGPYSYSNSNCAEISMTERLSRLNQAVLQQCVKEIVSGIKMYIQYTKDASSMPIPLDRPTNVSSKGGRVLSENVGLYSSRNDNRSIQSYNLRNSVIN